MKNSKQSNRERYKKWYEANKEQARKKKRENMRRYRAENPTKYAEQSRKAKRKIRDQLFDIYGDTCKECGFDDKRALTLDHIQNNGNVERKELGERGVYQRARDNYLPNEYQILCMNCQFIKKVETQKQNQHLHGNY